MAFTETDLDGLIAAYTSGELSVTFQGRLKTYRSIAELERAITFVRGELAAATDAVTPRIRRVNIYQDDERGEFV